MLFVMTVGESIFSSSDIGDGRARRRKKFSVESLVEVRTRGWGKAAEVGGATGGVETLVSEGVSIVEKCP